MGTCFLISKVHNEASSSVHIMEGNKINSNDYKLTGEKGLKNKL